jgi:predicted DCC family thiol-disulfide oxidoreductase YuxK
VLRGLGWPWRVLSWLRFLPRPLTNWGYDFIAKRRLKFFGRLETCRIPTPAERARFIDDVA